MTSVMTSSHLRSLKEDDKEHIIKKIVDWTINSIIDLAKISDKTYYEHPIYPTLSSHPDYKFYSENYDDIVSRIKTLLPDCSINLIIKNSRRSIGTKQIDTNYLKMIKELEEIGAINIKSAHIYFRIEW